MLRYLAPKVPSRTTRSNLTTIFLDEGQSNIVFNKSIFGNSYSDFANDVEKARLDAPNTRDNTGPNVGYLVFNNLPPAPSPPSHPHDPNSSLCPPFHIHLKEDETFHVLSGTAKFLFLDQRYKSSRSKSEEPEPDGVGSQLVQAGGTITIPRGQIHTFRNASRSDRLELEFGFSPPALNSLIPKDELDPSNAEAQKLNSKMHLFFLNTQLYRSDCAKHGMPRSLLQVLLFNHHADVLLVPPFLLSLHQRFPLLRGLIERFIAPILGRIMNVFGGVVLGQWMFGLQPSYKEYTTLVPAATATEQVSQTVDQSAIMLSSIADEISQLEAVGTNTTPQEAHPLVCQAWRNHSFDGQDEAWRKDPA